jgi:predicted HicB family RNase H-like nuclease
MLGIEKKKYIITTIRLEENIVRKLKRLAKKEGISVNKAIDLFIKTELKRLGL